MNEFSDILTRLQEAYSGDAACGEGTLTGDVFHAAANELARIWSCDLEMVTSQVFLSTAQGEALDRCCADHGIVRKDGEGDEELRERALLFIRSGAASGSVSDYQSWAAGVPGVLRAKVLPGVRGKGTVDILLCGEDGGGAAALVDAVQAVIDEKRPVGAEPVVYAGVECPVDVEGAVTLEDGVTLGEVVEQFTAELRGFLLDCAYQTSILSYLKVSQLLLCCDGVEDVSEFFLSGEADSLPLTERQVPVVGTVTLTERT